MLALSNPDPEISPPKVKAVRPDAIICTGRSDYPNQVNNVLGFPFIFRGALDVRARAINDEMKFAASQALYKLTREDVPDSVLRAYGVDGRAEVIPTGLQPARAYWYRFTALGQRSAAGGTRTAPARRSAASNTSRSA